MTKANKNKSLEWLDAQQNIFLAEKIRAVSNPIRGVYGIFVKEEEYQEEICVYVGRAISIYDRMFGSGGHITKLMHGMHTNKKLNIALKNEKNIEIKIIKEVPLKFDNYYKDVQRLASAENKCIDHFHQKNECLEQVPEGTRLMEEDWYTLKQMNIILQNSICEILV